MQRLITSVLTLLTMTSGCDAGDDHTLLAPPGEPAAATAKALTISGECRGSFDFIAIDFLPPPQEDLAAHARLPGHGICHLSHLGKTVYLDEILVDFTGDPFVGNGTRVFIAANGDELWASETSLTPGPGDSSEFSTSGTFTFQGGTGRFVDAAGTAQYSGGGSIEDDGAHLLTRRHHHLGAVTTGGQHAASRGHGPGG